MTVHGIELDWKVVDRKLPGSHHASMFSIFAGVKAASSARLIDIRNQLQFLNYPQEYIPLDGQWERSVYPAQATDHSVAFGLPAPDAKWQAALIPQNYGLEPELEFYFGPVWYRRSLIRPQQAQWIDLCFGAVDYLADVVLDGQWLGRHEGYFAPFYFDLTDNLPSGKEVELIVRVQDPLEDLKDNEIVLKHRKRWIKGTLNYHDSRPGGPPGNTTPGWTFVLGQSKPSGGIVGPVSFRVTGPVRLDHLFITPLDLMGNVHVAMVFLNRTKDNLRAETILDLTAPGGASLQPTNLELDLVPGYNRLDLETCIPDPQLWYDASLSEIGQPNLYAARATALIVGQPSSSIQTTFGLRTADFPLEPSFHYVLNGRRVFLRAANYIPTQHWAKLDVDFYERDFQLLLDANLHSIGLHAHVQSPCCYTAADRMGISIFQDFPLCWGYASGSKEDLDFIPRATSMAAEMAYLLWNHPSVVYYTAHNEPLYVLKRYFAEVYPHDLKYAKGLGSQLKTRFLNFMLTRFFLPSEKTDTSELDGLNRQLDAAMKQTLEGVDPLRFIHMGSGAEFDWHDYTGTGAGGTVYDVGRIRKPFVSEYGSSPVDRTAVDHADHWARPWPPVGERLKTFYRQGLLWLETEEMVGAMWRYSDLASFAYACERKAAFAAKYHTEFYRIHRNQPYTGYRWHSFVNWWNWMGCGLLDVDRVPTMAYMAIGRASRSRLIATILPDTIFPPGRLTYPIYAINDSPSSWKATVNWQMQKLTACEVLRAEKSKNSSPFRSSVKGSYVMPLPEVSTVIAQGQSSGNIQPNETVLLENISFDLNATGAYQLVMRWDSPKEIEENEYTVLIMPGSWQPDYGLSVVWG